MLHWRYMRTFARVSGNRSATSPPPTSTDEAMRMGMAFVMPTREPKIRFPRTAASLQRALQKPKPVPLKRKTPERGNEQPLFICLPFECIGSVCPSPPDCREGLSSDHIQGVPGRDTQAVVKAQHENHHRLTRAKPQEEAADA